MVKSLGHFLAQRVTHGPVVFEMLFVSIYRRFTDLNAAMFDAIFIHVTLHSVMLFSVDQSTHRYSIGNIVHRIPCICLKRSISVLWTRSLADTPTCCLLHCPGQYSAAMVTLLYAIHCLTSHVSSIQRYAATIITLDAESLPWQPVRWTRLSEETDDWWKL